MGGAGGSYWAICWLFHVQVLFFRYSGPRLYPLTKSVGHQTSLMSCPTTYDAHKNILWSKRGGAPALRRSCVLRASQVSILKSQISHIANRPCPCPNIRTSITNSQLHPPSLNAEKAMRIAGTMRACWLRLAKERSGSGERRPPVRPTAQGSC
jgi:hypothetical protein